MRMAGRTPAARRPLSAALLTAAILLGALALRLGRLAWQPLWWDEGYSVYFATEPLGRMLWLTAHDIHPPLYYALLHLWTLLFGSGPVALRLLSVAIGTLAVAALAWFARVLYPERRRVHWVAPLLLAVSPIHLYYSQEVRMYALALLLGILATGWLWRAVEQLLAGASARRALLLHALLAALALYTLYYMALLFAVEALWALWLLRRKRAALYAVIVAYAAVFLAYLPWLVYALPRLYSYVGQKIGADSDQPLNLIEYILRHGRALLAGHVAPTASLAWASLLPALAAIALLLALAYVKRNGADRDLLPNPTRALLLFTLAPAAAAFLLNLRLPFFPEGGERLLLFVLPFVLLLLARAADVAWDAQRSAAAAAVGVLTLSGLFGAVLFYTTPRYVKDDYRPVIAQVVQQGAPNDSFLAIFPWMVGYWRAYAPSDMTGPTPLLLGDFAVAYTPAVAATVDTAIAGGTLWFPEPLGFGSSLPGEIEAHLRATALNVENRWISLTTRLSAWAMASRPSAQPLFAQFGNGPLLEAAGVQSDAVLGANVPLAIRLDWQGLDPDAMESVRVDLRLVDTADRTWGARSYSPPGSLAGDTQADGSATEFAGLLAPAGTPPGVYTVTVGLSDANGLRSASVDGLLLPAASIGTITVVLPDAAPDLAQMPLNEVVRRPRVDEALSIVGASLPETPLLAGTSAALRIAAENLAPTAAQRNLYVSILDAKGNLVTDWQGWPLPDFPTALWPQGARVLVPVEMDLPPSLAPGQYSVSAGWLDVGNELRTPAVELGNIEVEQRPASFAPLEPATPFDPPLLFGTHAVLEGYTITQTGQSLVIALDWRVEQPLLPPHHIFVHADDEGGATLAQSDGPPMSATGPAPTGTWQPAEQLRTIHTLTIPAGAPLSLRVGLYNPATQVRLPVSVDGAPAGDTVTLERVSAR